MKPWLCFTHCRLSLVFWSRVIFLISAKKMNEKTLCSSLQQRHSFSQRCCISFLLEENTILDDALIYIPVFGIQCLLAFLSFKHAQEGKYAGHYISIGWAVLAVGGLVSMLSAYSLLSSSTFLINWYWFALIPQTFLFIFALDKKTQLIDQEERSLRSRENRAAASLARLQQSKEAADQARLLRVIERERETYGRAARTRNPAHRRNCATQKNKPTSPIKQNLHSSRSLAMKSEPP